MKTTLHLTCSSALRKTREQIKRERPQGEGSVGRGHCAASKGQQLRSDGRWWLCRKTSLVLPDLIFQKLEPLFLLTFPNVETLANDSKSCKTLGSNQNSSEGQI